MTVPIPSIGPKSEAAYARALDVFPDGTTRVTVECDPLPRYIARGEGAWLVDVDGRRMLDLNGNFTTLIHGHAFAPVTEAVVRQLHSGSCFASPTEAEITLAATIRGRVPGIEHIRFVNTGSEAVLFAIKAARAFTGRTGIAKIEGAYHGSYDWAEVSQSVTPATWGPSKAPAAVSYYRGMPPSVLNEVVPLRFNDAEGAARAIAARAATLAAVLLDPMPSRAGLIAPEPAFVEAVQRTARAHGILVISDEVLNFRQGYAGASVRHGLHPDLYTLGKIIGGGFPVGAVAGRAEVMAVFDGKAGRPALPQGGTFSANPVSMVAGQVTLEHLDHAAFERLEELGDELRRRLSASIARHDAPFSVTGAASLFRIHPKPTPPREFRQAFLTPPEQTVMTALSRFFARQDIALPNGAAACLSTPMGLAEVELVAQAFDGFLATQAAVYEGLVR
ncbi:aspartate aminotransferase family protein [Azospirillum oleiclasticum]|nr:aminotransferase class III-fold pyridoxal phosphate-dependent enzyme [Azospirillum oleiclasticum]